MQTRTKNPTYAEKVMQKLTLTFTPYAFMCGNCKKAAFYLKKFPKQDEMLSHTDVILLNGSHPLSGDRVLCGACNWEIWDLNLAMILKVSD